MSIISAGTSNTTTLVYTGDTTGAMVFQTNGTTEAMRINTSQNVGIGATSPLARLHIEGNSSSAVQAFIENANGATNSSAELVFGTWSGAIPTGTGNPGPSAKISAINMASSDARTDLAFSTYASSATSAERMRITSAGNVGIGTTTPASKLDVFADTVTFGDTGSFNFAINGTNILFKNGVGGTTERMRITSTGQITLTRATGDDTQIDFLRMQGGGVSAGDNLAFLSKYTTTVSTSAKAIFGGPPRGCIVVVTGYTGASYFSDILNCSSNSVTVVSSQNSTGSPASRTYSISSFVLHLAMGSGTYNVGTLLLGTAPRE